MIRKKRNFQSNIQPGMFKKLSTDIFSNKPVLLLARWSSQKKFPSESSFTAGFPHVLQACSVMLVTNFYTCFQAMYMNNSI